MTPQGWSDDRVEMLKRLWLEGLSAAQVARQLGGVSRNAVIGKLHRLGLTGTRAAAARPRPIRRPGSRAARRDPPCPRAKRVPAPKRTVSAPALALEPGLVRDAAGLSPHVCKWPIGDPQDADFSFCGRPVPGEGPYCDAHHRIAHRARRAPPSDRDPVVRRLLAA